MLLVDIAGGTTKWDMISLFTRSYGKLFRLSQPRWTCKCPYSAGIVFSYYIEKAICDLNNYCSNSMPPAACLLITEQLDSDTHDLNPRNGLCGGNNVFQQIPLTNCQLDLYSMYCMVYTFEVLRLEASGRQPLDTSTLMIKHLMDKFCHKLQPPLIHILLILPNINPITQTNHVGITHSELVLVTSKIKSRLLWHTQSAWFWPLPAPTMSPSMCHTY